MLAVMADDLTYRLLDAGELRRLERFGRFVVERPAPTAAGWRLDHAAWRTADLRFDGADWTPAAAEVEPWTVAIDGLSMELRPTSSGGLGLYPEHAANIDWLAERVRERSAAGGAAPPAVLNLFAHTGLVTLAAARAGAAVAHVDAARGAVDWARGNARLSGLQDRPVRWLVDDAAAFVAREARRGRRYDGIVLDPPSFGRAGTRRWRLADELPALLAACAAVAGNDTFVLLTAHTAGIAAEDLRAALEAAFRPNVPVEVRPLVLRGTSGVSLDLGWTARFDPRSVRPPVPDGTSGHGPGVGPRKTGGR